MRSLEAELPEQQCNTYVRPLQALEREGGLQLYAPNRFVVDWVKGELLARIENLLAEQENAPGRVSLAVGARPAPAAEHGGNGAHAPAGVAQAPTTLQSR